VNREASLQGLLIRWIEAVMRRALVVTLAFSLAGAAALVYTLRNIRISTDRDAMLSSELPFRRNHERYKQAFPQFQDNLIVVVDGDVPERAREAAQALGAELEGRKEIFRSVYLPRADAFLEQHGLLFMDLDELEDMSDRLAEVQPFLGRLTRDPSLRGLFEMLEEALRAKLDDGREIELGPMLRRTQAAARAAIDGQRHVLSWQELLRDETSSLEDRRQFLVLQVQLDYGKLFPGATAMTAVRDAAARLVLAHGVRVRMTGGVALADEELGSVCQGAGRIAAMVTAMVALVLVLGLRSLRLVLATLWSLFIGLAMTAAFATAAIGHLNLISVAFAILYLGLGVDYAIHICLRYQERIDEGAGHTTAMRGTVSDVGGSVTICALTTALGFFAFVPTAYVGVSELGLISGVGMFISLVITLTVLPALLTLSPLRRRQASPRREWGFVIALAELPFKHGRIVRATAVVLGLVSVTLLAGVRFDSNPMNLRDPRSESVATFRDLLLNSSTPPWSMQVLAPADRAAELGRELKRSGELGTVVSIADFVPAEQDDKLDVLADLSLMVGPTLTVETPQPPPDACERLQAVRSLARTLREYADSEIGRSDSDAAGLASALERLEPAAEAGQEGDLLGRLEASLVQTLPANLQLLSASLEAEAVRRESLPAELQARWISPSGLNRVEVFPRTDLEDEGSMRAFVASVLRSAPDATGSPLMILESGDAVVGAFREAFLYALIATALILVALLRPRLDAVWVLGMLLLAGVLTGASTQLASIPFNFANVIALPLLLGIGVDSGVHMVQRAREHRDGGDGGDNPLRSSTARAVVLSSLTTLVSFVNLAGSAHRGTASMGLLLTLGIGWTLLCALWVLPAFLSRRPGGPHELRTP
jgi:hypothetical protein